MIKIEIDGKKVEVEPGSMIIEAADNEGIYIPRFCYHKKLSIAANCRMCLVEVEKSPKPLPACATPVTDGMKVMTKSAKALEAQKYVMEFLLINHPLDCPICDQGGECELQDISMGFGRDSSDFNERKHCVDDDDLGPLIATDMTRCIHCTRCVRFGQEIAGVREIGMLNRGNESQISTYVKHSLKSELSGNIIDLCPVGALTSKPYRFRARSWELTQTQSISPHDCLGSNFFIHTRREKVMRVVPHDNEAINETWISDRDRFSYLGLHHEDRIGKPLIKHQGEWQEVDWTKAFSYAAKGLREIVREFGGEQVAALLAGNTTNEEGYLLQKLMRELGSDNVDYRVQQQDFRDDNNHQLRCDAKISDFSDCDSCFLIGSNIRREQPILSNRIRTATQDCDAEVVALNPFEVDYNFSLVENKVCHPYKMVGELQAILNALNNDDSSITKVLNKEGKKLIVLGALALNHPDAAIIRSLARQIAEKTSAALIELPDAANAKGLEQVGCRPSKGLNAQLAIQEALKAYILYNLEPEFDCANPAAIRKSLNNADFVIAISSYRSALLDETADIILPIVPFSETEGSFTNIAGTEQKFEAAAPCFEEARPGWKVLRVLGNMLELDGYQYSSATDVRTELQNETQANTFQESKLNGLSTQMQVDETKLTRICEWPLYRSDSIVRRSEPLQLSGGNEALSLKANSETAKKLGISTAKMVKATQAGHSVELPFEISERLPNDCIYLATAYTETAKLGESFGTIEVEAI